MTIFIDESGLFANPANRSHYVSCIAALVVPEAVLPRVLEEFGAIVANWADIGGELKGSKLNDRRIAKVVTMLGNFDIVLIMIAIDIGIHPDSVITQHKSAQKKGMTRQLTPEHSEGLRRDAEELGDRIAALPNQLYVESVLLTKAVDSVIQTGTFYYSQKDPATLGAFSWRIDAKDRTLTEYEELWSFIVKPSVQGSSLRDPTIFLEGGDYRAFARFENADLERAPDYLQRAVRTPNAPFSSFSLNRVMDSDLTFGDSCADPGLTLADILANAFQRACNGKLHERGWSKLGGLMVRDPRDNLQPRLVSLSSQVSRANPIGSMPYARVIEHMRANARPFLVGRT